MPRDIPGLVNRMSQNSMLYFVLMRSPYLKSTKLIGAIASAMNARSEFPQPRPRALYIFGPASGRNAPPKDLKTVFAAIAEAACVVKASTR